MRRRPGATRGPRSSTTDHSTRRPSRPVPSEQPSVASKPYPTGAAGQGAEREPVAHGERERVLADRLHGLLHRIGRGRNDGDAFLLESVLGALESSQLLLAIRSPVSAVDEEDAPTGAEVVGQGQAPVLHGVDRERREALATVEDPGSRSRHDGLPSQLRREASGGLSPATRREGRPVPARTWKGQLCAPGPGWPGERPPQGRPGAPHRDPGLRDGRDRAQTPDRVDLASGCVHRLASRHPYDNPRARAAIPGGTAIPTNPVPSGAYSRLLSDAAPRGGRHLPLIGEAHWHSTDHDDAVPDEADFRLLPSALPHDHGGAAGEDSPGF